MPSPDPSAALSPGCRIGHGLPSPDPEPGVSAFGCHYNTVPPIRRLRPGTCPILLRLLVDFFVSVFFPHGLKLPLPGPYIVPPSSPVLPRPFFSFTSHSSLFFLIPSLVLYTPTWFNWIGLVLGRPTWELNLLPITGRPSSLPPLNPMPRPRSP